jgi:transcriptional regulator with XRE-family HTH domain
VAAIAGVDVSFPENLKRLRESKGWTQAEAAKHAGVPFRSYQNWESGGREPRLDALVRLAAAFGVTPNKLLEGVGTPAAVDEASPQPMRAMGKRK